MAVYTVLEKSEVNDLINKFDCGELVDFKGITAGVENTNYFIYTDKAQYVLTIFEKRVNVDDLPYFISLMNHMNANDINCPQVIKNKNGEELQTIAGKTAILISFLSGKSVDGEITPAICGKVGEILARMHNSTVDFELRRKNELSLDGWTNLYSEIKDNMSDEYRDMVDEELSFQNQNKADNLPNGAIHGDLFVDNVFINNGEVSGVIDFYFACDDSYLYDLAITITAWCFEDFDNINIDMATQMLNEYQKVRPLNELEKSMFAVMLRGAGLRVFLTRQYDEINTPSDADVVVKDPSEYARKLKFYQNNTLDKLL